ncbi:MAG TPA: hypothetical protein DCP38_17100 [Acidobacteria bacterium]|nr:hypothetical protein [Acidobacteriota bacterium]
MSASRRRFLESAAFGSAAVVFTGVESLAAGRPGVPAASRSAEAEQLSAIVDRYGPEFGPRKAVR